MRKPRTYSISDARTHLPALVREAEAGQQIKLTRRGRPVAVVISLGEFQRLQTGKGSFGERYGEFLKTHSPREDGLDRAFIESLRTDETGREPVW